MNTSSWDKLLNKKMNRKEFLTHIGMALVAIVGIPGVIKALSELGLDRKPTLGSGSQTKNHPDGYSGGAYGGTEDHP